MEKAYDVKDLAEKLKAVGLEIGEDGAKKAIEVTCSWLEESAKLSAQPYDDMALVVLPKIKAMALGVADKIDGQEG